MSNPNIQGFEESVANGTSSQQVNSSIALTDSSSFILHPSSLMQLVWQSRWGLPIGYSSSSEELALQLERLGVELHYRPTLHSEATSLRQPLLQAAAARSPRDDLLQVSYDQADLFYTEHPGYKVGYTMLEVDGMRAEWVAACNRMDELWVPSRFNVETFEASGVRRPIHVMPLGYDPVRFHTELPARRLHNRYTFLSVFEWGERKAPEVLLRTYARTFTRRDDVLLIVRVNNFDNEVDVARQIADLNLPTDAAPIALIYNQHLAAAQLGSLYRSADCFVLPTRGEGWGLPILEAMACGLPTIATNWSGQTEFMHPDVSYPLRVKALVPAIARCVYYLGFQWAEPDEEHLAQLMRHAYEHPDEGRAMGRRAADYAASNWTWEQAARRLLARLEAIGWS